MRLTIIILLLWSHAFGQSSNLIRLDGSHTVNTTYSKIYPERLFDNDQATKMNATGVIKSFASPFVWWLVMDSTYENMKIDYYHTTGASSWIVRVYSDGWDTATADKREFRFSGVFNSLATISQLDTVSFPIRLIRFEASSAESSVMELYVYGDAVNIGSTYLPVSGTWPSDPGKYFYGFSDLYPNQQYDDAGWSIRWMGYMDYVDTSLFTAWNAHTYVFSKFQNDLTDKWAPTLAAGRKIHPYYEQASEDYKYTPGVGGRNSKDIPIGYDSLDIDSWINQYRVAAAAVTNFSLEYYEVGNEDQADWVDNLRYHSPGVLLTKWKAGAAGARSADPDVKVIGGALTYLDTSFLKGMYLLNKFSGDAWPVDAIGINDYNTTGGGQQIPGTDGVSPEQGRVITRWGGLKTFVEKYFPGNEVHQMEGGYDTATSSYNVPTISGTYREKTKAQWNLRHWLWMASAQMHRMFIYTARHQGGVDFGTTGFEYVVESPPGVFTTQPSDSYYYYATFANEIAGYNAWPQILVNGDSTGISVFKFTHLTNPDSVLFAVVKGTHSNSTTSNYVLNMGVLPLNGVTRSVLSAPNTRGTQTTLSNNYMSVTIPTVDETVQFIRVLKAPFTPLFRIRQRIRFG